MSALIQLNMLNLKACEISYVSHLDGIGENYGNGRYENHRNDWALKQSTSALF